MKHAMIMLCASLCLIGCTSSIEMTKDDQYAEINERGSMSRATVTLKAVARDNDYDADFVNVGRDSILWVDPETGLARFASTADLRRIRFTSAVGGALEGAMYCALPGLGFATIGLIAGETHNNGGGPSMTEFGVAALFVGGAIGAIPGAIIGHKTDYEFKRR